MNESPDLVVRPLVPERWPDLERLFGTRGAYGGCWCMWWRLKRSEFEVQKGEGNRRSFRRIVLDGEAPGVLAFEGEEPIGWCAVAPRESLGSLNRSRVLKPLDETPVWSITCFFVRPSHRGRGVIRTLIRGAVQHVRSQGGRVVEAYPTLPRGRRLPPVSSYMGLPDLFAREGFVERARPSQARAVMRYEIPQPE